MNHSALDPRRLGAVLLAVSALAGTADAARKPKGAEAGVEVAGGAPTDAGSPASAAPARPDRVVIVAVNDPDQVTGLADCLTRFFSESPTHLVVFRSGVCIVDRGLRSLSSQGVVEGKAMIEEKGLVESAWVAPDGRGALLATVRYTDRVGISERVGDEPGDGLHVATTISWIDPAFPEGRFETPLEPGRVVKNAAALPLGFGAAVLTQVQDSFDADFRMYDLLGKLVLRVPESEASAAAVSTTTKGGFVLVDFVLPLSPTGPDRALRVYDLLQGKSWDYTWSYGSEAEPLAWALDDGGILELKLPGATRRFDRNGAPVGGTGSTKGSRRSSGLFNRLRD